MDNEQFTNPSPKPVKTMGSGVAALILLLVGSFALFGGYVIYQNSQIPKSYSKTHGVVTNNAPGLNNRTYDIGVKFTANDGKEYQFTASVASESALHNSAYFNGSNTIQVAYDPQNPGHNPKNATDKSTPVYAVLIMAVGGLFALLGLISTLQQLIFRK